MGDIKNNGYGIFNYFGDLFTAGPSEDMEPCIRHIAMGVTGEMNADLLKGFTNEEVGVAISQMATLKASGPDGFMAKFFQKI
jgi:hypothetical protein